MSIEPFTADEDDAALAVGSAEPARPASMVEALTRRKALLVSTICALVALVVEVKSLMVIPMTGTFISDVGLSPVTAGWVLLSAQLVSVATTGLLARLGDVYGHRKVLLNVLIAIFLGNVLTGLAQNTEMVLAGRVLSGLSATSALLLAIMRDWMEPRELRQGIGFISGIQGIGVSLSFLFAGIFLELGFDWRTVFLICAGLALINIVTLLVFVPESVTRARVKLDYVGAALMGVWLTFLMLAISKSTQWGWTGGNTLSCLAAAAVIGALWAWHESRHPQPLVDLSVAFGPRLLPAFVATAAMAFGAFICYIGITNFVQIPKELAGYGFGYTVFQGGLVLLPCAATITVMSIFTGDLIGKFGARPLMVLGLALMAGIFFYWRWNHTDVWMFLAPGVIWGFGLAIVFAGGFTVATVEARPGETGITNGMLMVWSSIGSALGTAVTTALRAKEFIPGTPISIESGWSDTFLAGGVVAVIGLVAALLIPRGVGQGLSARTAGGR